MTRRDSDHRGYYICFDCESHIRQGDKSQVVSRTVEKVSKNGAKFKVLYQGVRICGKCIKKKEEV